jgi:asparagine synthase (glutamine-hydrolysing)
MPEAAVRADRSAIAAGTGWVATIPRFGLSAAQPAIRIDGDIEAPGIAVVHNRSVMFDGALYNGADLAREFGLSSTTTPAAVVAHAWQTWGVSALDRLKGIFLLAVADHGGESITIARDPLGVYPGFYVLTGDALHVSTSVAPLLSAKGVSRAVNRIAIADHLCHRWPDPEETYFEQVRRLPPANVLTVTATGVSRRQYWDPDPIDRPTRWATDDELDQFESVLDRAVSRAMGFGPTGIFLSGGFDSISVAAFATDIARRTAQRDPIALSLAFPDPSCNEEMVQRGVAKGLGLDQILLSFDDALGGRGLIEAATDLIAQWPVPMLNLWNPAYGALAARGRARGCRVILTGNGGDEWLAVSPFLAADLIKSLDVVGFIRFATTLKRSYRASRLSLWRGAVWTFGLRPLMSAALGRMAPVAWRESRERRLIASTPAWIAPDRALRAQMDARAGRNLADPNPPAGFYRRDARTALDHPLMAIELEEHFEFSRRLGVRLLHPYWDADLVDLLARIPPSVLNRGGRTKGMVRHALARRFPGLGFERQKKVAATSFYHRILLEDGPRLWRAMGGASELARLEIVDARMLESTVHALFAGAQPQQLYRLWDVLGLEAWLRAQTN